MEETTTLRDTPEFKHFRVVPVTPHIGGRIEGMHLSEVNDQNIDELRRALWHYGVLFAKEQHLSADQMKKIALYFGDELEQHSYARTLDGDPEVLLIEMVYADKAKLTTDIWHHDVTGRKHPNIMSVLQADEVPFGADTMWASASAAYESLPYALKLLFLNLDIDHDAAYAVLRHGFADSSNIALRMIERGEATTHPAVVHHHATGRPCMFVGNGYIKRVSEYSTELSELILKMANELPKLPEFQVRHQWSPGDVAIWDNFGTWHYGVVSGIRGQVRRLRRVAAVSRSISPTLDRARAMQELVASRA